MAKKIKDRSIMVLLAGTGINLALGVLYTWSIFKSAIKQDIETGGSAGFNWDPASLNDPYAICCLTFAFAMILAGKSQDRLGPRITAIIGGILVGLGFLWISQSTSYSSWIMGFGLMIGTGIAFGYSSATPAAMKWFPPNKTGRVAGIVVAGFGLASVYIAPLAIYLLNSRGLQGAMLFFGIAFFLVVTILALFLVNPPADFEPSGFIDRRCSSDSNQEKREIIVHHELSPATIIKTRTFWKLWLLYLVGAGAGLMVIGSIAGMAKQSLGEKAFLAVALLAIGNASGRIVAGYLSDKMGRRPTLISMFCFQAALMFLAVPVIGSQSANAFFLVLLATFIGFNYGANLTIFPAFTKDLWGMENFGVNYGLLFTAWGVGGFVMSRFSQFIIAKTGSFSNSFIVAGILLIAGAALALTITNEKGTKRRKIRKGHL